MYIKGYGFHLPCVCLIHTTHDNLSTLALPVPARWPHRVSALVHSADIPCALLLVVTCLLCLRLDSRILAVPSFVRIAGLPCHAKSQKNEPRHQRLIQTQLLTNKSCPTNMQIARLLAHSTHRSGIQNLCIMSYYKFATLPVQHIVCSSVYRRFYNICGILDCK